MLETPHVIVGAAIATKVVHPALAIPLAFASHFILEKVPHWNPHLGRETKKYGKITKNTTVLVTIDSSLALATGTFLSLKALPNWTLAATIFFSCFFAALPDIVEAPYFFLHVRNKVVEKWIRFQKSLQEDAKILPGLTTQIVTTIVALWWIMK